MMKKMVYLLLLVGAGAAYASDGATRTGEETRTPQQQTGAARRKKREEQQPSVFPVGDQPAAVSACAAADDGVESGERFEIDLTGSDVPTEGSSPRKTWSVSGSQPPGVRQVLAEARTEGSGASQDITTEVTGQHGAESGEEAPEGESTRGLFGKKKKKAGAGAGSNEGPVQQPGGTPQQPPVTSVPLHQDSTHSPLPPAPHAAHPLVAPQVGAEHTPSVVPLLPPKPTGTTPPPPSVTSVPPHQDPTHQPLPSVDPSKGASSHTPPVVPPQGEDDDGGKGNGNPSGRVDLVPDPGSDKKDGNPSNTLPGGLKPEGPKVPNDGNGDGDNGPKSSLYNIPPTPPKDPKKVLAQAASSSWKTDVTKIVFVPVGYAATAFTNLVGPKASAGVTATSSALLLLKSRGYLPGGEELHAVLQGLTAGSALAQMHQHADTIAAAGGSLVAGARSLISKS